MGRLKVILYQAKNLAVENTWGYSDPACYVSVGTITHAVSAPKSNVYKLKQVNPVWNMELFFEIADPAVSAYLRVVIYDVDNNDREIPIGEMWVSLLELAMGQEWKGTIQLNNAASGEVTLGLIALDYSPNGNRYNNNQLSQAQSYPPSYSPSPNSIAQPQNPQVVLQNGPSHHIMFQQSHSQIVYHQPTQIVPQQQNIPHNMLLNQLIPQQHLPQTPQIHPQSIPSQIILQQNDNSAIQRPIPINQPIGVPPPAQPLNNPQQVKPLGHPKNSNGSLIRFNPTDLYRDFPHIAKGSFGVVFKGRASNIPGVVVIKDMEIQNNKSVNDWKKEIVVMSKYRNPYVVEIYGYCSHQSVLTIVMEYMANGDLYGVLHKHSKRHPLSMLQRLRMARHCALGLAFLHSNRVIHRDIKSMNILVTEDYSCKLTDFGCAKLMPDRYHENNMTRNSGTPLWMAPEVKGSQYTLSADIYSLGLVLYEIFERKLPDYNQPTGTVTLPQYYQSRNVINPCINKIPEKRPLASEVVHNIDLLIHNILMTVRTLLPEYEQERLRREANTNSEEGKDLLEVELVQLYRQLLSEPPYKVDQLISKGFQMSLDNNGVAYPQTSGSSLFVLKPSSVPAQPQQYQQPHQYQQQYQQQQPQAPGYIYPLSNSEPPPPYSSSAPPPYTPAHSAPPPSYKEAVRPVTNNVYSYLEDMNIYELKTILTKCGIDTPALTRQELILTIKQTCSPELILELLTS